MALPKLNVPVYEAVLPSTEKVIKYRPFLVKEEKLLLTAQESGEDAVLPAVKQIIKNCVQGELDVDNMPIFDIEYLFLRLRAKSVGEEVTLGLKPWGCPNNKGELCEKTTKVIKEMKVDVLKKFSYRNPNIFKAKDFELHMEANSLYEPLDFTYQTQDSVNGIFGALHQVHNDKTPVHKKYVLLNCVSYVNCS